MTASTRRSVLRTGIARLATAAIAAALLVPSAIPAAADAAQPGPQHNRAAQVAPHRGHHRHLGKAERRKLRRLAQRRRRSRLRARRARARRSHSATRQASRGAGRTAGEADVAPNAPVGGAKHRTDAPAPAAEPVASESGVLDAGFESGLLNWNTAGVGEALPSVVEDEVRSGSRAGRFVLTGSQDRSELILGGNGGGSADGVVEFGEGAEYWYGFSFEIDQMVYGGPGAHNLIMQFKGDDDGSPAFGLQLWDYEGDDGEYADEPRGLWSHGPAMDGDRFLAPVAEHVWHDVVIHFKASAVDAGFYEVFLDGALIDARSGVSMIADGASFAYIKDGLYRNGGSIPGTSEIHLDAARLGHSLAEVVPG